MCSMSIDSACVQRCHQSIYTWGMVGARLADVSNRVVVAGVPMLAVPGVSRFWSADAADGGKILTWENFFLNRNTNTPISAQLELKPSGDYIARSNLVERLYRRVNPDDWDSEKPSRDAELLAGAGSLGKAVSCSAETRPLNLCLELIKIPLND